MDSYVFTYSGGRLVDNLPIGNYFLNIPGMNEEVKVWSQMFFDDGSVTQGKYIPRYVYDNEDCIKQQALTFLMDTSRREGVLFIWGAGRVYARKCKLLLLKGRETLRLSHL